MMEINSKEELIKVIGDLQGQMGNIQETVDKLSPVEDKGDEPDDPGKEEGSKEEPSEEEVSEIDKLLQD